MENVQPRLALDEAECLAGSVWRGFIHDNDQMTSRMVFEHLTQERNDFRRSNPFVVQPKQELASATDGGHMARVIKIGLVSRIRG